MRYWIFVVSILLFFTSCSQQDETDKAGKNTFKEIKLDYAKCFRIYQNQTQYKIDWIFPDNDKVVATSVFNKEDTIPMKAVILSSTAVGYLKEIQKLQNVVGVENLNRIDNRLLKDKANVHRLKEYGDYRLLNPERLYQDGVNTLFYSLFESKIPEMDEKFQKLKIKTIPLLEWKEEDPLGKAEWLKVYGIVCGDYLKAKKAYDLIKSTYLKLKEEIQQRKTTKPLVICGNMYQDIWYFPGGNSYMAKLITDAGGNYALKDNNNVGAAQLTFEQVYRKYANAPIWINMEVASKKDLLSLYEGYANFDAYKTGHLFSYYSKMLEFFENSSVNPQKILSDLNHIFKGETNAHLYYYRRVN